ncbi:pyridoxamine 5'-phosphate oxidase [Candidatus Gracilibacteria bacterium]|nr:pyridoxamine 5'-phosphate oxidase [Candidatus Gracilibacteria bacterium]
MSYRMTQAEREHFLADMRVGIISITDEGRGPLAVPVWYGYEPGGTIAVWMSKTSRKADLLQRTGRFSLCVQTEQTPYRYVSVEGPIVAIEPVDLERDARPIARRYLGVEAGDAYVATTTDTITRGEDVVFRMRPERWLTADYSRQSDDQ